MTQKLLRRMTASVLLGVIPWSSYAAAQGTPLSEPPPFVRFTGTLLSYEEKDRKGLHFLTVSITGTKWLLRITNVQKLTGRDPDGWRLLQALFPPEVRFVGPPELLQLLQNPHIAGKPLTIEGRLYVGERMFFVTTIVETAERPK